MRDPLDDFRDREEALAQELEKCPVCDLCNEPIQDDDFYDIPGAGFVCENCLRHYRRSLDNYINY